MSGAGADPVVRGFIALSYRGAGRPMRWLVTITGEPLCSSVPSARNSNATSTEPTTAKKSENWHWRPFRNARFLRTLIKPANAVGRVGSTTKRLGTHAPEARHGIGPCFPRVSRATPQCVLGFQISAFEMPDAPANEAEVLFIFEGGFTWFPDSLLLAAVVHRLGVLAKRQHDAPLIRTKTPRAAA